MNPVAENPVIVPDRELEEQKKPTASEPPRTRYPLCGWSPRKTTNGCAPAGMSGTRSIREASAPPAFTNGLKLRPFLQPMVAAFGLVRTVIRTQASYGRLVKSLAI